MSEFDRIIAFNFGKYKSLRWLIVALSIALVVVVAANVWVRVNRAEPVDPRAGITCMDDAGGGVYCWRAK